MLSERLKDQSEQIPEALAAFGVNKHIPAIIARNVLTALSFYPELRPACINFRFKQRISSSVMQAQPDFSTILMRRKHRRYVINISSMFRLIHTAIPIHELPDDIMIGWIGHELGHIMDYERRSNTGLVGFGISYLTSPAYVKRVEQIADQFAVDHGLGPYLIATKRFILTHAHLPQAYKDKIARLYVSPEVIVEQVRKLEDAKAANGLTNQSLQE